MTPAMIGYYQRKWSSAARWSERLAALAIPYFAISILLHRFDLITSPQVFWLIGVGLLIVIASLLLGLRGIGQVWRGMRGGGSASRGVIVSLAILAPFAWYAYLGITKPPISDASSDPVLPPNFIVAAGVRDALSTAGANPLADYDTVYGQLLLQRYPQLTSRRYNTGAERVYGVVREMIENRRWRTAAVRGIAEPVLAGGESETTDPKPDPEGEVAGEAENELLTAALPEDIRIEAVNRSLIFGFRQDIVIEIVSEEESTLVDMRASTRWGSHDFGRNARTISQFLADLDKALIGIAGEG